MFKAALFVITKNWKQPKYSSTSEWIKTVIYQSMKYHKNFF